MRERALLLAGLSLSTALTAVTPAAAGTQIIPTRAETAPQTTARPVDEFAGPVIAGNAVVWVEQRLAQGYRVQARDAAGTREIARGSGRRESLGVAASGGRVGLLTEKEVRTGTLTSPFSVLASCASGVVCRPGMGGIAVDDDAVAFRRGRGGALGLDVVNFTSDGSLTTRSFPKASGLFAVAGRFVATGNADQTKLEVFDRVSGEPVYSLARGGGVFDIQADGTAVFQTSRGQLAYASVAEPFAHQLGFGLAGPGERSDAATAIAGDRIVITNGRRFALETLAGAIRNLPVVPALQGGFDFDGKRLAFAVKPCLVSSVVTWDVDRGAFPTTPKGPCPAARLSVRDRRVSPAGRVTVTLRCPADRLLGCPGFIGVGGRELRFYNLLPGRTTTRTVTLDAAQRRSLRRRGSLTVSFESQANSSSAENQTQVRRIRLRSR